MITDETVRDLVPSLSDHSKKIRQGLADEDFMLIRSADFLDLILDEAVDDQTVERFVRSRDDLKPDTYMADGGTCRLRRYATFTAGATRVGVSGGETSIQTPDERPLDSFTLSTPFDTALVDDRRVAHGVTPVLPVQADRPGHRDILVVTFRRK